MVKVLIITALSLVFYFIQSFLFFFDTKYNAAFSEDVYLPRLEYDYPDRKTVNCVAGFNCSWEIYNIDNEKYLKIQKKSEVLRSNASEDMALGSDLPICLPRSFGYKDRHADIIFPLKQFPSCETIMEEDKQIIWIDETTRELHMACQGTYFIGESRDNELIGRSQVNLTEFQWKKPVKLDKEIEWAYGTCKSKTRKLEGATYQNYFDRDLYEIARERMRKTQKTMNFDYKVNQTTKPLTVLFLSIDSLSRKLFYRRLPKTVDYLNSLNAEKFRVFDFKLSNIIGDNSIPNVFSILTGYSMGYSSKEEKLENAELDEDLIESSSIWTYMKSKGWVTMFGTEFCENYFSYEIGRKPSVDFISSKFWCAGEVLADYDAVSQTQRCIGNKNSHYYILNYTYQYVKNYQGVNKWAHIMTLPAHEDSGTVISSLDQDLVDFLARLLNTSDPVFLFILADHGPRYGNWKKTLDGAQEHKLPSLFLVASTDMLKLIPNSFDILSYNTRRLVSKIDLFKTLQHLTLLPYYQDFELEGFQDNQWNSGRFGMYGLMLKKIPADRSCEDALIERAYCSCNDYILINPDDQKPEDKKFIWSLGELIVNELNQEAQTNFFYDSRKTCKKLTLKEIEKIELLKFSRCKHAYRLRLSFNEEATKIEGQVFALCVRKMRKPARFFYDNRNVFIAGKMQVKVDYIKRLTKNRCEDFVLSKSLSPDICSCGDD